jgi:hypothetical protein
MPLGPRLVLIQSATAKLVCDFTFSGLNVGCSDVFCLFVFIVGGLPGLLWCLNHFAFPLDIFISI